jgi:MSHA biogenesis protein MshN
MSLINKMLQDLDARGGAQAGHSSVPQMRAVTTGQPPRAMMAAGAGLAVVLLGLSGWLGWRFMHKPEAVPAAAPAAPAAARAATPAAPNAAPAAGSVAAGSGAAAPHGSAPLLAVVRPMPVAPDAVAPDAGDTAASFSRRPPRAKADEHSAAELAAELKAAKKKARQARIEAERLAAADAATAKASAKALAAAGRAAASAAGTADAPAAARAAKAEPKAKAVRSAETATPPGTGGVTVTSQQQGENAYRRGLAALQEGRVPDALANMEQAVFLYPRHDTARQTLVGLLIENKRLDEAMRHLQFGLGLDLKQPQMAMILARLQIEKGGPAIETLQRTLPYAGGNGDYIAFLAGALQRAQRNREAAEQYQAALRLQPQNGVWWMGLGIALMADKRNPEAQEAFTRAKNSGNLSQELQSFVDRKLQQLGR